MIKVKIDKLQGENFEKWKIRAQEARQKLIDEWEKTGLPPQNFDKKIWTDLKNEFLLEIHANKCAYCETNISSGTTLHVEHYRPKAEVTERTIDNDQTTRKHCQHPGYFWLAYEWENLILSCPNCNSYHKTGIDKRHPGKLNEFRIKGIRTNQPSSNPENWFNELTSESPLLLHPYFDEPENEIDFDSNGIPFGLTDRGKETIEVCDLARLPLVEDRIHEKDGYISIILGICNGSTEVVDDSTRKYSAWSKVCIKQMIQRIAKGINCEVSFVSTNNVDET